MTAKGFLKTALSVVALGVCAAANAVPVTVGVDQGINSNNCYPFGCGGITEYRQVYSAGAFSTGGAIDAISFFADETYPTSIIFSGVTWTLSLSTTNSAVGSSSLNLGADNAVVYTGTTPTMTAGVATFNLNSLFNYNPLAGNLLLRVTYTGFPSGGNIGALSADIRSSGGPTSRTWNNNTNSDGSITAGLVTRFNFTQVPEPATALLFGMGLAAFAARRRVAPRK